MNSNIGTAPSTANSSAWTAPSPAARRAKHALTGLVFLGPMLLLTTVLIAVPTINGVLHSFTDWQPGYDSPFVGLLNYTDLVTSPVFHSILWNQAVLLLMVPLTVLCALAAAFALQEGVPAPGLFRTVLFFPTALPAAVAGIAFVFVLSPDGPINSLLGGLGLGKWRTNWLSSATWVKPVLILVLCWASVGVGVMIFSAALRTVPRELIEAIRLDGGNRRAELRHIVIPWLRPTIELFTVLMIIQVFLWSFPWIYVMTAGGPGYASTTVDWDIYQNTLRFGRYGIGAAEAVIVLLLVGLILLAGARISRRERG